MAATVIAQRYANALAEIVLAPNSGLDARDIALKLHGMVELIHSSADLRSVLLSPAVPASKKRNVMGRLVEPLGLPRQLRNFFFVLVDRRRVANLRDIADAFEGAIDKGLGFVSADVTSAQELSAEQRQRLEEQIARISGKKARVRYGVDQALVGGVVAKVGSYIYDGSVRGQLDRLRQRLAGQ
jgi:F-type H+-transporting ATPase subunit delta